MKKFIAFIFAALFSFATVFAEPTVVQNAAIREAIRHGGNGFLAKADEWYGILKQIVEGEFDLHKIATVAREECLQRYYGENYRNALAEVFHEIARKNAL